MHLPRHPRPLSENVARLNTLLAPPTKERAASPDTDFYRVRSTLYPNLLLNIHPN